MSKKKWYKRTHQFTPYTKADGQAVSDEFDAIQASFERIPEMRDDGKGFAVSPIIPEPTDQNHPVTLKMLTETEASVNNARDDVIAKAQQVAQNTQTVETNTQTAINQANSATQSATSAAASSQSADESEDWARKWASNPIDEPVSGDKYSAHHYASKAATSAQNLSAAERSAKTNADIAVQKAEEAKISASKAKSIADGEVEYEKVLNVPRASSTQAGIVQLTSDTGLDSENLGLTAKAGKVLAQGIAALRLVLNNYIPNSKKSNAVNSNNNDTVATSAAVKSANDNANGRVSKSGDTMTGGLSIKQGDYSGISLYNNDGYYLRLEGNNHANGTMLTAVYRKPNGENVAVAFLPKRDGTIAYVDDVVRKTGDTMTGTLSINKSTDRYPIGSYTWGVSLSLSGDAMISNGVTGVAFNNNGALHLGGRKNSPEFIATIDSEGIYTGGVMRATGHTAKAYGHGTFANQWDDKKAPYVVNNPNANGENIYYPFIKGLNTNGNQYGTAFSFGYMTPGTINQFGSGAIHLITDSGNGRIWWFEHNGDFNSAGDVRSSGGKSLNKSVSIDDFSQNLSGNGWCKLPNGLIMQWGISNGGWVNFPIAFPHQCFSVIGTPNGGGNYENYIIFNISNTRFFHKGKYDSDANNAKWIAIGN